MIYDLFVDESGSFEKKGEHTLIGGILVPHDRCPSQAVFSSWEKDMRSAACKSGLLDHTTLAAGDELHRLYVQKKSRHGYLSPADQARYDELRFKPYYVMDHCSENSQIGQCKIRWKVQRLVLEQYMDKLAAVGGVPVVFDNPDGVYHIDSNSTFMAIFANGFVRLYAALKDEHPEEEIRILIHAASRKNITLSNQQDLHKISPTAGAEKILDRPLYLNKIKDCVFLNGGSELLELKSFTESLESFEILMDLKDDTPHPATVICDYVCNSCLTFLSHQELFDILQNAGLRLFHVLGDPVAFSSASIDLMVERHDWTSYLKGLLSRNLPKDDVRIFFERVQKEKTAVQMNCVDGLVSYLYPFVQGRESMQEWVERLRDLLSCCTGFQPEVYQYLRANVLIYLYALYTHLGQEKKNEETIQEFISCVGKIRALDQRDALLIYFFNRKIVSDTDIFEYDRAAGWFEVIRQYTTSVIRASNNLMLDFVSGVGSEDIEDAQYIQYGRALGSYIQLLAKQLRMSEGEERIRLAGKAEEAMSKAFAHFSQPGDIDRAHQNVCDLLVELGRYDEALSHLYQACGGSDAADIGAQAEKILQETGRYGEKEYGIFLYLHYVYLMHRCFVTGDPLAQIMLNAILKEPISGAKFQHLLNQPHPQSLIAWHLGVSLALGSTSINLAADLLDNAVQTLLESGSAVFMICGAAAQAEVLSLTLRGILKDKNVKAASEAIRFAEVQLPAISERTGLNPFKGVPLRREHLAEDLLSIANRIAY